MDRQLPRKAEEHYLISESPEIAVGENDIWARRFKAFPALQKVITVFQCSVRLARR